MTTPTCGLVGCEDISAETQEIDGLPRRLCETHARNYRNGFVVAVSMGGTAWKTDPPFPIGPLGEPYDPRAWTTGSPPCGPCGRGEHDACKIEFEDLAGRRECYCPVCYPQ